MSLVGADGKNLKVDATDEKEKIYRVGNIVLTTNATPNNKLNDALAGARQVATMQLIAEAKRRAASAAVYVSDESLKVQAIAEASKVEDPFTMEPCAQAVFMMLAIEIESRDATIQKLINRVEELEKRWPSEQEKASLLGDGQQN